MKSPEPKAQKQPAPPINRVDKSRIVPGGLVEHALKLGGELVHVHPQAEGPGSGQPGRAREVPIPEKK